MATNGENTVTFPCGTIFRVTYDDGERRTALVLEDGRIRILRINEHTPKSPYWQFNRSTLDGKTVDEFISSHATLRPGWTLTADVRPPKDWWNEAGRVWRSLPAGMSLEEKWRVTDAAYAKAREGWAEYVRRLQALYPAFTTMEKAPEGANVPFRLAAVAAPAAAAPVLETLNRILESAPTPATPETITLTRDQMNYIYTVASGHAMSDDVWATVKKIAVAS